MFKGEVIAINISPHNEQPMQQVDAVRAIEGKGLEGDRYANRDGTFSKKDGPDREVTLIELEAIEAAARKYELDIGLGDPRRNIVTKAVPLNHLVGRRFRVGEVILEGMKLA